MSVFDRIFRRESADPEPPAEPSRAEPPRGEQRDLRACPECGGLGVEITTHESAAREFLCVTGGHHYSAPMALPDASAF